MKRPFLLRSASLRSFPRLASSLHRPRRLVSTPDLCDGIAQIRFSIKPLAPWSYLWPPTRFIPAHPLSSLSAHIAVPFLERSYQQSNRLSIHPFSFPCSQFTLFLRISPSEKMAREGHGGKNVQTHVCPYLIYSVFSACPLCNIYGQVIYRTIIYCGLEGFCTKCIRGLSVIKCRIFYFIRH